MKICTLVRVGMTVMAVAASALLPMSVVAQTTQSAGGAEKWQFTATIYGWIPAISMKVPTNPGSVDLSVTSKEVLDALHMAAAGSFEARYGRWGIYSDFVYVDLRGHDFLDDLIDQETPSRLKLDFKAWIWTTAGEYRVVSDRAWSLDLLAGTRWTRFKPTISGAPGGDTKVDKANWDGIIGVKGRYTFGDDRGWYLPYYLDVGTGDTQMTYQITGGVGYSYDWGSVFATWRYLAYNFKSGGMLDDVSLSGPMVGVEFQW